MPAEHVREGRRERVTSVAALLRRWMDVERRLVGDERRRRENRERERRGDERACDGDADEDAAHDGVSHDRFERDASEREEWWIRGRKIVVFSAARNDCDCRECECDGDETDGAQPFHCKRCDEAEQRKGGEERRHDDDLVQRKRKRAGGDVFEMGVAHEFAEREAVCGLPEHRRKSDERRDRNADPELAVAQDATLGEHDQPGRESREPQRKRVLRFHRQPRDEAGPQRRAPVVSDRHAGEPVRNERPCQRFERRRVDRCGEPHQHGREAGGGARAPRCPVAAAEQAREFHDDPHERGRGDDRRQALDPRLRAERVGRCVEERHERRLVNVTECRVPSAHDEVQFVSKEIVAIRHGQMQCGDDGRQDDGGSISHVVCLAPRGTKVSARALGRGSRRRASAGVALAPAFRYAVAVEVSWLLVDASAAIVVDGSVSAVIAAYSLASTSDASPRIKSA